MCRFPVPPEEAAGFYSCSWKGTCSRSFSRSLTEREARSSGGTRQTGLRTQQTRLLAGSRTPLSPGGGKWVPAAGPCLRGPLTG